MESTDPKIVYEEQVKAIGLKLLPSDKLKIQYYIDMFVQNYSTWFISFWIKGRNHLVLFKYLELNSKVLKYGVLQDVKTSFLVLIM